MVKRKEKGKKKLIKVVMHFLTNLRKPNKSCPLSGKGAPEINYKNIKLLKKYVSDTAKILPSRITNVSFGKQRALSKEIKKARVLALMPYVGN